MNDDLHPLSPQDSLVMVMMTVSASDAQVRTSELHTIQSIINHLPIFAGYDGDRMRNVAQVVFDLLDEDEGIEAVLGLVRETCQKIGTKPPMQWPDVAAGDGYLEQTELRLCKKVVTNWMCHA